MLPTCMPGGPWRRWPPAQPAPRWHPIGKRATPRALASTARRHAGRRPPGPVWGKGGKVPGMGDPWCHRALACGLPDGNTSRCLQPPSRSFRSRNPSSPAAVIPHEARCTISSRLPSCTPRTPPPRASRGEPARQPGGRPGRRLRPRGSAPAGRPACGVRRHSRWPPRVPGSAGGWSTWAWLGG